MDAFPVLPQMTSNDLNVLQLWTANPQHPPGEPKHPTDTPQPPPSPSSSLVELAVVGLVRENFLDADAAAAAAGSLGFRGCEVCERCEECEETEKTEKSEESYECVFGQWDLGWRVYCGI